MPLDLAARLVASENGPVGAAVGVAHGAYTYVDVAGEDGAGAVLTRELRFDLASVSKVVATTTTLHRLIGSGVLSLDTTVQSVLPDTSCAPETTVRDVLLHRAGLWEWQPLYFSRRPMRESVMSLPLRYEPGTSRHYSDLGFMTLGWIIEAVTELSLDRAADELVFEPFGLENTEYGPSHNAVASSRGDAAERTMVQTQEPYPLLFDDPGMRWRDYLVQGEVNDGNAFHAGAGIAGHAGVFSTVDDLLTLGRVLAHAEADPSFADPAVTRAFFADGRDAGQALGWRSMTYAGKRMLWHPGFTGTGFGFVPGEDTAIVMLTNRLLARTPQPTQDLWNVTVQSIPNLPLEGPHDR